jgi:hypothetical protein
MTVENKPGHRGERAISRKTIARGMPDVSGVTVVTNACAFYYCARGCGRAERPAFPAPSDGRGRNEQAKPRAKPAARTLTHISTSLPATNAKRLRKGAQATKLSILSVARWIASQSLSSGAHLRDPLVRNDGLTRLFEI